MKKYPSYGLLLALSVLVAVPVMAQSTAPQEEQISLNLIAQAARTHLLTPSSPTVTETIAIDDADEVNIVFGSPSKTLKIELISPSGKRFSSGNIDTGGVRSRIFPDPADPKTTGANYLFVLSKPQAGKWSYIIQETVPLTKPRGILMNLFSSSPVRAGITSAELNNRANRDVNLSLIVVEGQNIVKKPSIKATLTKVDDPAFPQRAVNFHDDGVNGDAVAGDGLFTASVQPRVAGEFQIFANIEGTNAKGSPFQRTASTTFKVQKDRAHFSGSFSDRGIDTNGDGLFEQIGVSPAIRVLEAGKYFIKVKLTASNGESTFSNTTVDLPIGNASPEVKFASEDIKQFLKVNGPYQVTEIFLDNFDSSDRAVNLGSTAPYQIGQLQREAIVLSGEGSAVGVDVNGNGKFDFLDVSIPVDFLYSGDYKWSAFLGIGDEKRTHITLNSRGGSFSAGNADLKLRFNGAAIGDKKLNGPYVIQNLIVYGGGRSLRGGDALTTQKFTASAFEGFIKDQEPPQVSFSVTPITLEPPNHQMVEIKVNAQVSDNVDPDPARRLQSITTNDGQIVKGDRTTSTDIEIKSDGRVFLRAELSKNSQKRVYTLTYVAKDSAGNVTQATAEVQVPREPGK